MKKRQILIITILMLILLEIFLPLKSFAVDSIVNIGAGSKSWTQYIKYHSNYPNGSDKVFTVQYNIKNYVNMYNSFNTIKTLSDCGFSTPSSYKAKAQVWNTSKSGSGTGYEENANYVFYQSQDGTTLDLYAIWEEDKVDYYLNYDANGGKNAPASQTVSVPTTFLSATFTISSTKPTRQGFIFKGWSETPNAMSVDYNPGQNANFSNKTTTLYAVWEITYTLDYKTFEYNIENMPTKFTKITNTSTENVKITSQEPKRVGYKFIGWSEKTNSNNVEYTPNQNIILTSEKTTKTLYPVWEKDNQDDKNLYSEYNIEYYYDNIKDNSKTENGIRDAVSTEITANKLNEKIKYNIKPNYKYVSIVGTPVTIKKGETPIIKVFYESIEKEEPLDPNDPNKLFTITVENNKDGHKYNSYQVFAGDYYEETDEQGNKKAILSNIEWGAELNKVIVTDVEEDSGKTHGDKIVELLKSSNEEKYKDCITASDVADVLSQYPEHDNEVIRNFVNVVGKYIKDNNITITKDTTEFLEYADSTTGVITNTYYQIKDLIPGYYIVIDAETSEKDDSFSRYLIDVAQDVTMHVKTSIPTLTKTVGENNLQKEIETTVMDEQTGEEKTVKSTIKDNTHNTATYKANGNYDIKFQLNTTIPDTDTYEEYKFVIRDIIAKGFDFDANSLVITIGGTEYKDYVLRNNADEITGNRILEIDFGNLVEKIANNTVQKAQDVVIKYNARLNANAETGYIPNINEAYLMYSNNPYDKNSSTQTTTVNTYTYSIKLDISKIAEKEKNLLDENGEIPEEVLIYLEGAEFEIYDGPEYIVNEDGKKEKNTSRNLIATIVSSDEELNKGHAVYNSLGAGTYYIKESKSPNGYNKLKEEIEIEILATYDGFGIGWGVNDKSSNILVKAIPKTEDGIEGKIPYISLEVQNTSGFQLPATGGVGTIIFTVIGLSVMALAVFRLKSNRKK